MRFLRLKRTWTVAVLIVAAVVVALNWRRTTPVSNSPPAVKPAEPVVSAARDEIEVSERVVRLGGIKTVLASEPTQPRALVLRGSLGIDPNRLAHVHTRFQGQIVEIGMLEEPAQQTFGSAPRKRPLGYTDHVKEGQRLAVVWSKDLGEKKSELVDAQAKLKLDEQTLTRLSALAERGSVSERSVRDAERAVEVGLIAVNKAELTLKSWALSSEEIAKIKAEAERIRKRQSSVDETSGDWARVDIVSPIDGAIVEKNAIMYDIVDTTTDLFKIADLSVLNVSLHAYEEDLHYLERLPRPIRAELRVPANPELGVVEATIDKIGEIVDPNEHMALLIGSVANPKGYLKTGQFVSATIDIGFEHNVIEIPATALVDQGDDSYIFVQPHLDVPRFVCRKVQVVRRSHDVVYVRGRLTDEERERGLKELHAGERVVSRGALELKEDLDQRAAQGES
jgi:membrane fusion protein, heavy metal efflux system